MASDVVMAEIILDQGWDWACVDMEHSNYTEAEMMQLISIINLKNIKSFVRLRENTEASVKRALDAGARGVIAPRINSVEETINLINWCFYPPKGKRGMGLGKASGFGFKFDEYLSHSKDVEIYTQIEHYEAIDSLTALLQVEGLTGTFIGPYDLSASLNHPGDFNHPEVKRYLKLYDEITAKSKLKKGYHVISTKFEDIEEKANLGYSFIAFSTDALFLGKAIENELNKRK